MLIPECVVDAQNAKLIKINLCVRLAKKKLDLLLI